MASRPNFYFNNPAFAAAASNIAQMYAPPSGTEVAAWEKARALKNDTNRLAQLFDMATAENFDPVAFDRAGMGAGRWNPTQSMYAVNQADATKRYGIDTAARTSITNNAADNQRALATNRLDNQARVVNGLYGPLNPGQVRPDVPADVAAIMGMPEMPAVAGAPKPLSESEVKGAILGTLPAGEQRAAALGSTPVETIIGPDGKPVVSWRADAVGQTPYTQSGSPPKPINGMAVYGDGRRVQARQDPSTGIWVDAQNGQQLPEGFQIYDAPKIQGSASDVGLTTGVNSEIQKRYISLSDTLQTAKRLKKLMLENPASFGAVGGIRSFLQDIGQTGSEMAQQFGGVVKEIDDAVKNQMIDAGDAQAMFYDPKLPRAQLLANLLTWQYAKSLSGDRVSNEQLRAARDALNLSGIVSNTRSGSESVSELIDQWQTQMDALAPMVPGALKAPRQDHVTPPDVPDGVDPADWAVMTPEERALFQ